MSASFLLLAAGLICAGIGGEWFLRAASGLARAWRLSTAFVGASIAAFATSSPELSVAIGSAFAGTPQIALGDCIGSNVVNVALILGAALMLGPLRCSRESLQRDLPMALLAPVVTALMALDGTLSRLDGMLMVALFIAWIAAGFRQARKSERLEPGGPAKPIRSVMLAGIAGLGLLVAASKLIVSGAAGVAVAFGWNPFAIGAVLVAVGTSTPEIVTTLLARWHGQDDIGLGTILGSSVFNLLFIVAVTAMMCPITIGGRGAWIGLGVGLATTVLAYPRSGGVIGRGQGAVLLACYFAYVGTTLWFESSPDAESTHAAPASGQIVVSPHVLRVIHGRGIE
jgi:cation:H+ antiporter